jgi:hypothetical protein
MLSDEDVKLSLKMKNIVDRAQASIKKVINSPIRKINRHEHTGNDSLDEMKHEFMNDYNKVMQESGETFFKPEHPHLSASKDHQNQKYLN